MLQVLPNPEKRGKDLGVFNIANALPGSLAPFLGVGPLAVGAGTNYTMLLTTAAAVALVGAFIILPIKRVR